MRRSETVIQKCGWVVKSTSSYCRNGATSNCPTPTIQTEISLFLNGKFVNVNHTRSTLNAPSMHLAYFINHSRRRGLLTQASCKPGRRHASNSRPAPIAQISVLHTAAVHRGDGSDPRSRELERRPAASRVMRQSLTPRLRFKRSRGSLPAHDHRDAAPAIATIHASSTAPAARLQPPCRRHQR